MNKLAALQEKLWYRLVKVLYFIFLLLAASIAVASIDESEWIQVVVATSCVILFFEMVRRVFYYIVLGEFFPGSTSSVRMQVLQAVKFHKNTILIVFVSLLFAAGFFAVFPTLQMKLNSIEWGEYEYFIQNADQVIERHLPQAEGGDAHSQFRVGLAYRDKKDYANALHWLQQSTDKNENHAQAVLGYMYLKGEGAVKDETKAQDLFAKAIANGNSYAMLTVWHMNRQKDLSDDEKRKNDELLQKAIPLLRKEANDGEPWAEKGLGLLYLEGAGVPQDQKLARELLEKAANKGHAASQYILGMMYKNGDGVDKDPYKSFSYLNQAAEDGDEDAQYQFAFAYYEGEGAAIDYDKAVEWWTKSAEQDNTEAQFTLGKVYQAGLGSIEVDSKKAFDFFEQAAVAGHAEAQYELSNAYKEGVGVAKNYDQANAWLQKSADQNYAPALFDLGEKYLWGVGIQKNLEKSQSLFLRAAQNGDAKMKYAAGQYLHDKVASYMWTLISAAEGEKTAKLNIRHHESGLTAEEISRGQKMALEYQESNRSSAH